MIIVDRPTFRLRLTVASDGDRRSLELHQLHPRAQRPHWRRITQLNLSQEELGDLATAVRTAHINGELP